VKGEQLSLLLTRPLGVKSVINPEAATGGADPESRADARRNVPLTVLTLDRTVSLQDYEDFARAYAGIAKALATWTWEGQTRRVFITVAGPAGADVPSGSDLYKNLLAAVKKAGDPFVNVTVKSYRKALFRLAANTKIHSDHLPEKVLAAVEQSLRDEFSFDRRAFGQPVMLSEVIAVIQAVPGVVAVDVDKFYRSDQPAAPNHRLLAALPEVGADGDMAAAELLTLDPAPLDALGVMP
jgi:predicted phage baseplate assembly protein